MSKKNANTNVVLTRIPPGNSPGVHQIPGIFPLRVAFLVAAWRGLSELLLRRCELASTGELELRVARRRSDRIERTLARARLRAPAREAVRVPVVAATRSGVHATVEVGSIQGSDIDDVGLLESAMRRAAARPPLVTYIEETPSPAPAAGRAVAATPPAADAEAHRTDWGGMLGEEHWVGRAWKVVDALGALPLLAMVVGVLLTVYPLVRPLDDVAPWLAIGGLALVGAGVLGSRWHQAVSPEFHDLDDGDDDDE